MARASIPEPRVIYTSPCGRIRVEREAHREYILYCDGVYNTTYDYGYQAEAAGLVWLVEQAAELTVLLADEQADWDAAQQEGAVVV